jgi:hypothetical protein
MAKIFRPSTREASILSKIESTKEYARRKSLNALRDRAETLSNNIAMKLVENKFVETTSKNDLEDQILQCLERLGRAEDFDIDYQNAPLRQLVPNPHVISLYVTVFVIEQLINNKIIIDIFGSDEEIYHCINSQVAKQML